MKTWRARLLSRRAVARAVWAACVGGAAWPVAAQEMMAPGPQVDFRCVVRTDAVASPEYPQDAVRLKSEGEVRLRLTFVDAGSAPRVEVIGSSTGSDLEGAAVRHARGNRLPCMPAGAAPAVAMQLYSFRISGAQQVSPGPLQDEIGEQGRCVQMNGQGFPWATRPTYPPTALRRGQSGVVLAQLSFVSAGEAPQVEILFDGGNAMLSDSVRTHVSAARMPCKVEGPPFVVQLPFRFSIPGQRRTLLRDVDLAVFVSAIGAEGLARPANKVSFDLSAMGCPFHVRYRPYAPYTSNQVSVEEPYDARREPLLNWMRQVQLALTPEQMKSVLGELMTVSVPCGSLDLT